MGKRQTVLLTALLWLSVLLAGCTVADGPAKGTATPPLLYQELTLTKANLSDDTNGLSLLFRVHEDVTLNLTWDKSTLPGETDEATDRCGSTAITKYARGGDTVGEPIMRDGMAWGDSSGRVFTMGLGGERETVEHPAARETLLLPMDWSYTREEAFTGGEFLRISLYMKNPSDDHISASAGFRAPHPALQLVDARPTAFHCSASLDEFDGEILSGGGASSATFVRDATHYEKTKQATTASFLVLMDPRFPGSCTTSISIDGETKSNTGPETKFCYLEVGGPSGSVGFHVDQLTGVGPVYLSLLWDTTEP